MRIAMLVALTFGMLQLFSVLNTNGFTIPDYTHVYGYVRDPAGNPLKNVHVTILGDDDYTDSNGRYDLYITRDYQYHGVGFSLSGFHNANGIIRADRQNVRLDKVLHPIKSFTFEGRSWYKEIRNRGTNPGTDYFDMEYYKVDWNVGAYVTVSEKLDTYLRYVGISTSYYFNAVGTNSIDITFDARTDASYDGQNKLYVGIFTSNWVRVGSLQSVTSWKTFKTFTLTFSGLSNGVTYNIFFFYSDSWNTNYHATFSLMDISIYPNYN